MFFNTRLGFFFYRLSKLNHIKKLYGLVLNLNYIKKNQIKRLFSTEECHFMDD